MKHPVRFDNFQLLWIMCECSHFTSCAHDKIYVSIVSYSPLLIWLRVDSHFRGWIHSRRQLPYFLQIILDTLRCFHQKLIFDTIKSAIRSCFLFTQTVGILCFTLYFSKTAMAFFFYRSMILNVSLVSFALKFSIRITNSVLFFIDWYDIYL